MTAKDEPIINHISLDDVHAQKMHELEAEPIKEDEPIKDEPKTPEVQTPSDVPEDKNLEPEEPVKEEPKVEEPKVVIPPEPILDTDITKPGDNKIAIKNSDGVMNYFNSIDEVPEDFEPATYKEFAVAVSKFTDKAIADKESAHEREVALKQAENQKEIDAVTSAWDKDIDVLTKGGVLPADEKERKTEIGDTYAYIADKISQGIIVDSFAEAHKAMMYDKLQEAKKIVEADKIKTTKEKGSKVMGGMSSAASGSKPKEALPAGVTLDQVHARYSGLI